VKRATTGQPKYHHGHGFHKKKSFWLLQTL
jgi:hypothetical protein